MAYVEDSDDDDYAMVWLGVHLFFSFRSTLTLIDMSKNILNIEIKIKNLR